MEKLNKKNSIIIILFLFLIVLKNIIGITIYIDFLIVLIFFIVLLLFGDGNFECKISVVLLFSIFSTDKIIIKGMNFRIEDFITIFLIGIIISKLKIKSKNDYLIIIYILYNISILLFNAIFRSNQLKYILIILKEMQYFVYFWFYKFISKEERNFQELVNIIFLCSIANIVWGIYQVVEGIIAYYGIGCLSSTTPAHSGGMFLIIAIFNCFFYYKELKLKYLIITIFASLLTILTGSRTSIIGICFFIFLVLLYNFYLLLENVRVNKKGIFIIFIFLIISGIYLISQNDNVYINNIMLRFSRLDYSSSIRINKWIEYIESSSFAGIIWGNGKGYPELFKNTGFSLSTDSQYICQILETGIVGLIMWLIILYQVSFGHKHHDSVAHFFSMSIILVYLLMGITLEIFQTTLQASSLWIFLGFIYSINYTNMKNKN